MYFVVLQQLGCSKRTRNSRDRAEHFCIAGLFFIARYQESPKKNINVIKKSCRKNWRGWSDISTFMDLACISGFGSSPGPSETMKYHEKSLPRQAIFVPHYARRVLRLGDRAGGLGVLPRSTCATVKTARQNINFPSI